MPVLTCAHCGNTSPAVHPWPAYIGGKGYVSLMECDDRVACWHSWDKAHGLVAPESEKEVKK